MSMPLEPLTTASATPSQQRWPSRATYTAIVLMAGLVAYVVWAQERRESMMVEVLEICDSLKLTDRQCGDLQMRTYFNRPWLPHGI